MKKSVFLSVLVPLIFFISCKSTQVTNNQTETSLTEKENTFIQTEEPDVLSDTIPTDIPEQLQDKSYQLQKTEAEKEEQKDSITLLFAGDVMAHTVNYKISTYSKIYRDVKYLINDSDLAFANIEAPVDTTKAASSYPNFNMTKKYVEAAVNAGFNVFSLCNNHCNDQGLNGIKETIKTTSEITEKYEEAENPVYFSGLKETASESTYTYNLIQQNGWKILFLPVTEILNRPDNSKYINYVSNTEAARKGFLKYVKKLREENPCDLFVLSLHAYEPEYTRTVKASQKEYYLQLLDAGIDIVWANHAHIIKDRQFVYNSKTGSQKLIMYANGNTISGQRTKPDFQAKYPDYERDNTGDGLFYFVTFKKDVKKELPPQITMAKPVFITTYINTADEFVIKPLTKEFIDYLYDVPRNNWAEYVKKRIIIDEEKTKDLIIWQ